MQKKLYKMRTKIVFEVFFSILVSNVFMHELHAQDSVKVWKMQFTYYMKSKVSGAKTDDAFLDIAQNKGVVLYYTPQKYKVIFNKNLWEIGDLDANLCYKVRKNIAYEGLIFMPDELIIKGQSLYLFANDYNVAETTDILNIAGVNCTKFTAVPSIKQSKTSAIIYATNLYPPIPWYPFAFTSNMEGAFFCIEKTVQKVKTEGIRLKAVTEINVSKSFFNLPEGIKTIKIIAPPALPRN
jgi:hypothetical protein